MRKSFSLFRNKSLHWKIMVSMATAVAIMSLSFFITMRIDHYAMSIIGSSYKSNSELNSFSKYLAQAESAMEVYYNYRTFESIDNYYSACARIEEFCSGMQQFPSTNQIKQKEYVACQLASSFLYLSGKTIAARRANSSGTEVYARSLACYRALIDQISSLSLMLLEKNASVYEADTKNVNLLLRVYVILFAVFFLFMLLALNFFIRSITRPLAEISSVALRVADRDFDIPLFNSESHDEVGNICRAFDRMIISIREYIDTIWEKARTENELREREMEMQALYADAQLQAFQSQINPHFLFNTLNTGAQLAMMEGADKTCFFIEQTSDFFRYNIQQQKKDATIKDELGLVDNFVYIMKVRFGQRLEFEKNVPESLCLELPLPSMTLQPLVENCIKHGLQNSRGIVVLSVKELDDFVEISVSDNGEGFDPEMKKEFFEKASLGKTAIVSSSEDREHTGIGLLNVCSRLRIYFQRDDVFDISENEGGGTKFIVRVYKKNEGER